MASPSASIHSRGAERGRGDRRIHREPFARTIRTPRCLTTIAAALVFATGVACRARGAAPPGAPGPQLDAAVALATPVLTAFGYDTIRLGASPAEPSEYALADDGSYQDRCRIFLTDRVPGLAVMVENGKITRLSASARAAGASKVRTDRGIGVGSMEAEVRAAYAPLREEPHKYVAAPAKDLFFGGSEDVPGLRFEIGPDGRVIEVHAGRMPALGYVEGCS